MGTTLSIVLGTIIIWLIITYLVMSYQLKHAKEMEETEYGLVEITTDVKRATNELKYKGEDKVFLTIGIDFDGSVVTHEYPKIGTALPHAVETMKEWQSKYGVGFILSTMRSGKLLDDAVNWFNENGIKLYGVQKHPTQETWTDSPKCHCRWMLDDRNIGTPLTTDKNGTPCVDWKKVKELFEPTLRNTYLITREYTKKS